MVINIILFLLHKYVAKLDILRTRYLKYKRMKRVVFVLTLLMDSFVQATQRMLKLDLYGYIKFNLSYIRALFTVLRTIVYYQHEFEVYEKECKENKLKHSIEILENLRLAS